MNRALTSQNAWLENYLLLNRANYKLLQVALVGIGLSEDRYAVLKPECATDKLTTEKRKSKWVQFYINAIALGVDPETLPDIQSCELISADGAALDGTRASYTTNLAGTNNDIVWTAKERGPSGNTLQIQYVDPASNSQPISVSVVGNTIRVSLATNSGGGITSNAAAVRIAVANHPSASTLIFGEIAPGNTGSSVVTALAATNLSGGAN